MRTIGLSVSRLWEPTMMTTMMTRFLAQAEFYYNPLQRVLGEGLKKSDQIPFELGTHPLHPGEEGAGGGVGEGGPAVPARLTVSSPRSHFTPGSQSLTSTPAEHP